MTDEQRAKRIHYHMYETCEGIAEHAERIVRLEEENAKLRELTHKTLMFFRLNSWPCDFCEWGEECKESNSCIAPQKLEDMASELGIEDYDD